MPWKVSTLRDMIMGNDVKKYWLTLSKENGGKTPSKLPHAVQVTSVYGIDSLHPFFIRSTYISAKASWRNKNILKSFEKPFLLRKIWYFFQLGSKIWKGYVCKTWKAPFMLLNKVKNPFFLVICCFLRSEKGFAY